MTQKEIAELRRRFRPDKSAINHIYGCYVNGNREIISYLDEPLGIMPQEESEKYLSLLKSRCPAHRARTSLTSCSPHSRWRTARSTVS